MSTRKLKKRKKQAQKKEITAKLVEKDFLWDAEPNGNRFWICGNLVSYEKFRDELFKIGLHLSFETGKIEKIEKKKDLQVPLEQHHVLVEFACTNCMHCVYTPTIVLGSYPTDLDEFEKHAKEAGAIPERHIGPVFSNKKTEALNLPGGYARCGEYKLARIWKLWENPNRYQEEGDGKQSR